MGIRPGFGLTARDAMLAFRANSTDCRHQIVSVESLSGETVGALCERCLVEVPIMWIPGLPSN